MPAIPKRLLGGVLPMLHDPDGHEVRFYTTPTTLLNVREGTVISVFDAENGSQSDDFCVIHVKRSSPECTVRTFERSYEDDDVLVSYGKKNGLDGKVSRVRVN